MNKSPEKIRKMFDKIANYYDFANRIISFGLDKHIKRKCISLLDFKNVSTVLDLCTGTGDIAGIIHESHPNIKVVGADFSPKMLEIARKKHPKIEFIQADCTNLPFKDNSFDCVTITYGLRNIENTEQALKEIRRVLKDGGELLHLDFGEKTIAGKIYEKLLPIITKIMLGENEAYKYLAKSKAEFYTPDELIQHIKDSGFVLRERRDFLCRSITCEIFK